MSNSGALTQRDTLLQMSDFSVQTGSLGSASQAIATDTANLQGEFSWLEAGESFEDRTVGSAITEMLLSWRVTIDRVLGDLHTLSGNLQAAEASYGAADEAIAKVAADASPASPKGEASA